MNFDKKIKGFLKNLFKKKIVDPVLEEKRLKILKQQYSEIVKYFDEKADQHNNIRKLQSEENNSICPSCKSTFVNYR